MMGNNLRKNRGRRLLGDRPEKAELSTTAFLLDRRGMGNRHGRILADRTRQGLLCPCRSVRFGNWALDPVRRESSERPVCITGETIPSLREPHGRDTAWRQANVVRLKGPPLSDVPAGAEAFEAPRQNAITAGRWP